LFFHPPSIGWDCEHANSFQRISDVRKLSIPIWRWWV
jgi:hypothetical protein